jgi:hypothetical protein
MAGPWETMHRSRPFAYELDFLLDLDYFDDLLKAYFPD